MAIIPQMKLFEWTEIQTLGDLKRLQLVLDSMPDEELMKELESHRGKGRDDYPVRAMWNSVLAGCARPNNTESNARDRSNVRWHKEFGFELHTIRGMSKMKIRCGLALLCDVGDGTRPHQGEPGL